MTPYWLFKCIDCGWYEQTHVLRGYCHMCRTEIGFNSYCPDWCSRKKNGIQYTDAHKKANEMTEQEFRKCLEDIVPKTLLSEKDIIKAKELSKEGCLIAVKYIKEHATEEIGLKTSKWYYDMYINNN